MAKRKAPDLSPEAQAANREGETRREKEKQARQKNAEKQARFRESMKAEGYKRVTLWDLPGGSHKKMMGMGYRQVPAWELPQEKSDKKKIKVAVSVRETSLNAAARLPEVKEAISGATNEFISAIGNSPEGKAVLNDFMELIKVIGDPWSEE